MSTEITVVNDIVEINVTEDVIVIEAPSGAYPLPTGVYSVYGRTGNVVAQDGDYNLTQLGDVTIVSPATGQVLRYNGTTWVNSTESYVGTVTSVNMSVPTGLTISGNPITTAGTLALGLASGYSIPTTAKQTTWDTAYNDSIVSAAVTGTTSKVLTLNQQDGGTITATWSDLQPVTSVFGRTGDVVAQSGDYNTLQVTENTNLYFTTQRARFSVSGDATSGVVYSNTTGIIALDDIPNTSLLNDSVTVNGSTVALGGSTSFTTSAVAEGTNLYYTDTRARAAITGTAPISITSGVVSISQSGPSTNGFLSSADWNTFNGKQSALTLGNLTSSDITVTGGTGAVVGSGSTMTLATVNSNVGTYGSSTAIPVITVNGKGLVTAVTTDAVFIPSGALSFIGDVTGTGNTGSNTTLTLATVNSNVGAYGTSTSVPTITVNAKGLVTAASQTAIPTSSSSTTGLLTSTDWTTFNAKQAQLNGTGFVKVSGTTVSYDNSTYLTTIEGITAGGELSGTYASPSLVNSAVTGKVLTGLNITGGTVSATDSILAAFGKVQNQINGLIGGSIYQGTWNASTNTPTLTSGVGTKGYYYIVSVAGTTNLDGITDWNLGDWAIYDGTAWQQVDNTDAVVSVNGFTGAVSLTTTDISEGTNQYFTDARARGSVSAGTGISYNSTTGVITNSAPDQTVSLTASTGISTSGTYPNFTITNTAPDQTVSLTASTGISTSGTYPNFTITNTAPDQTVSLTGAGTTSITGTYPNFTISSDDQFDGTVTSVGITSTAAALTITNSPITTSGNIGINFSGNGGQYVAGDGSLVNFPTVVTQAQNLVTEVYNNTGATLTKGTVVYINGGQGNLPTVTKAQANSDATSAQTYGVVRTDITNNNNGYITVVGNLDNIDTQAYAAGTQLYLSGTTAGAWTSTKPYAPIHLVYVGIVVRAHPTQGVVEIRIQNGYEMDELHNVSAQNPNNGDILQYVSSTSLWTKTAGTTSAIAEGTNLYFTDARSRGAISLTTTGNNGASTYNSTTGVLNVPTYTLAGLGGINLTSLSATSPLLYNNTTGVFSIQQSSGSQAGFLSAADWTTFNSKQNALTNPVTGTGTTNYLPKFTGASTIGNSLIQDNGTTITLGGALNGTSATFSGRVGINGAPSTTFGLESYGEGRFYQPLTNTTAYLRVENNRTRNAAVYTATTNGGFYAGVSIGTDTFNYQIYDGVAGSARLTIASTGAATFSSSVTAASGLYNGYTSGLPPTSGSATRGGLRLNNASNIALDFGTVAAGQAWLQVSDANNYASNFALLLNPNGGNVGIGTSSPALNLHIFTSGTSFTSSTITYSSATSRGILLDNSAGTSQSGNGIWFANSGLYSAIASTRVNTGNWGTDLRFYTHPDETTNQFDVTERMRITSGGQLLVNTTSSLYPNVKFCVKQTLGERTADIWSNWAGDQSTTALSIIKFDNVSSSSQVFQRFVIDNGNVACGQINGNGANQAAFGSWSDIRLKENVENLPFQLDNIMALRPVEFDYKDGSGHQIGFIAQEMKEIYADAVGEDSEGFLTITGWSKTEARLVKAIQEQQSLILELSAKVTALENK